MPMLPTQCVDSVINPRRQPASKPVYWAAWSCRYH